MVTQSEGNGVIPWRTVSPVRAVPTEHGFKIGKGFTDDLHRVNHLILSGLAIHTPHFYPLSPRGKRQDFASFSRVARTHARGFIGGKGQSEGWLFSFPIKSKYD